MAIQVGPTKGYLGCRYAYKKAGAMLTGLVERRDAQVGLFDARAPERSARLMGVLDHVNAALGRGTLRLAAQGGKREWGMRQERLSLRYTTSWDELPVARA